MIALIIKIIRGEDAGMFKVTIFNGAGNEVDCFTGTFLGCDEVARDWNVKAIHTVGI